jgi:organic hydroperoxide reductase OsmC/OhrA
MSDNPVYFPVRLLWTGGKSGEISVERKAIIRTGTPLGDQSEINYHTPEDLFVASATVCYMNGFINFTEKMHIGFNAFVCDAIGTLEKVGRSFEITKIEMKTRVEIYSEDLRHKINRALELAAKYCFVGNSMKCPISHSTEIVVV